MKKNKPSIGLIKFILIPVLAASCQRQVQTSDSPAVQDDVVVLSEAQLENSGIETGKTEIRKMSSVINVNGILDVPPQNLVTISAPMGGFVKETHLLQGMRVRQGEALIELQDIQYIQLQEDYIETQSQLDYAELEYKRQQELARENINAEKTLQKAKSTFEGLRARTEGLKAKLSMININPERIRDGSIQQTVKLLSPIDGYVTEVNINLGQYVRVADVLFKIVDNRHLHVELYVFEQDIARLRIGQKVDFNLINETTKRSATVHLIGREIMQDRTVRIHCHLDKEDRDLLPGMYVKAAIETDSENVSSLPDQAIVNFEGKTYIFTTVDGHSFRMEEIETGPSWGGYTEVFLKELGEKRIVTASAFVLLSKLKNTEDE